LPTTTELFEEPSTIVEFHPEVVVEKLAENLAFQFRYVWYRHRFETLRAVTLDCHPWHPVLSLCLLTTQEHEDFREDQHGKWDIAAWRLFQVADLDKDLRRLIYDYHGGRTIPDGDKPPVDTSNTSERAEEILRCCAKALKHEKVREWINKFQLASDFEVALFHPDDPDYGKASRDYCRLDSD
jgi:hypothetical protein